MKWERFFLCNPTYTMLHKPRLWRFFKWLHLSRGWNIQRLSDLSKRISGYGKVEVIIDVGVCWGTPALWKTNPEAKLILVDPGRIDSPRNRDFELVHAAAGSAAGTTSFNQVTEGNEGQSKTGFGDQTVNVIRLDSLDIPSGNIGIKVDVEGNEFDVLKGCEGFLSRTKWVLLEWNIHDGDCLPSEMVRWFAEHGFEFHDVLLIGPDPDAKFCDHFDAVFLKRDQQN